MGIRVSMMALALVLGTTAPRTAAARAGTIGTTETESLTTIRVEADPLGGGTAAGGGTYPVGSQQTISASAYSGWTFTGWSDGDTENPRAITVPATGTTYVARFNGYSGGLGPAVDAPQLAWTTSGTGLASSWFLQTQNTKDGVDAAASSGTDRYSGSTTYMSTVVTGPCTVAFWWQMVGLNPAFAWMAFSVDGAAHASAAYGAHWERPSFRVPAGEHTLAWTCGGSGQGYVDQLLVTPDTLQADVLLQAGAGGVAGLWRVDASCRPVSWTQAGPAPGGVWALRALDGDRVLLQYGEGGVIGIWDLDPETCQPVAWHEVSGPLAGWTALDLDGGRVLLQRGQGGSIGLWELGPDLRPARWAPLSGPIPNIVARALHGNRVAVQLGTSPLKGYWMLNARNQVEAWQPIPDWMPDGWILRDVTDHYILLQAGDGGMAGLWRLDGEGNVADWRQLTGPMPGWILRSVDETP